eukprot:1020991-Amphidinium_carterae.1
MGGCDWRLGGSVPLAAQPERLGSGIPLREAGAQRSASQQALHMATPTASRRHGVSPDSLSSRLSIHGAGCYGREASHPNMD